jgi:hypothetical protein
MEIHSQGKMNAQQRRPIRMQLSSKEEDGDDAADAEDKTTTFKKRRRQNRPLADMMTDVSDEMRAMQYEARTIVQDGRVWRLISCGPPRRAAYLGGVLCLVGALLVLLTE